MTSIEPPFSVVNEAAMTGAERHSESYEWCFVENALDPARKDSILADAPVIPDRGSYGLPDLKYGQDFGTVVQELLSTRFRRLVEQKFDMDLSGNPPVIVMMGNTTGHYNEGHAHPDSKHKIVTVLLGFSREWPYERGRLRVMRSPDLEDYAFEFAPEYGKMLMFRVCDHSWHGFLPQKGPRMSLQLCFCDSQAYVRSEYVRHRISAAAKSVPLIKKIIEWAPK